MGRVYAFDNGVLMLRNISAPFLNALDVRPRVDVFGLMFWRLPTCHQGKKHFCNSISFHVQNKTAHSWTHGEKSAPKLNTTACIYIYIYIYILLYYIINYFILQNIYIYNSLSLSLSSLFVSSVTPCIVSSLHALCNILFLLLLLCVPLFHSHEYVCRQVLTWTSFLSLIARNLPKHGVKWQRRRPKHPSANRAHKVQLRTRDFLVSLSIYIYTYIYIYIYMLWSYYLGHVGGF